jgi:hypothetical protein
MHYDLKLTTNYEPELTLQQVEEYNSRTSF